MTAFGERLRDLRHAAGLSQAELAGADLSASYISLLETGKRSASSEVVHQLAARLRCSPELLLEDRQSDRDQRIELEIAYAKLAITHGEAEDARSRLERLLAEDGTPLRLRDEITFLLASAYEYTGALHEALRLLAPLYERVVARASHLPLTDVAQLLCYCYVSAGDSARATAIGEQALVTARARGLAETYEFFQLAALVVFACTLKGDFLHARHLADQLLEEAEASGVRGGQGAVYWNAAILAEYEGRIGESLSLANRALAHLGELDDTRNYARLLVEIAGVHLVSDEPPVPQVDGLLTRARADLDDIGSRADLAGWNIAKSTVLLLQGDAAGAEGRAWQAVDQLDGGGPGERVKALLALQDALLAQHRDEEAAARRAEALALLTEMSPTRVLALQWRDLADRLAAIGDLAAAGAAYRQALDCASVRDRSRAVRDRIDQLRASATVPLGSGE